MTTKENWSSEDEPEQRWPAQEGSWRATGRAPMGFRQTLNASAKFALLTRSPLAPTPQERQLGAMAMTPSLQ